MTLFRTAVLLLCVASRASAQPAPVRRDTTISVAALREDAHVLRMALDSIHPGLHRYTTRAALDRRFAELDAHFAVDSTVVGAYLAFARLLGTIRCGHTLPNPANQGRGVSAAVFGDTPRVPFYFRWLDGHMVVTHDVSAARTFPVGSEVVAINGTRASRILAHLLPYSRTDGSNEAKRIATLELRPHERHAAFDVYLPHLVPLPAGAWTFRLRTPDGVLRTVSADPVQLAQRTALYDSLTRVQRDTASPPWTLRTDSSGLAVLTMPTWVTFNDHWDWTGFLQRAFEEIARAGTTDLVIDLRGNEGGSSVGDVILAHLVSRPLVFDQLQRFTRYRRVPTALRPRLDTWDRSFDDWGAAATPAIGRPGFFRLIRATDDSAGTVIRPQSPRFAGRVHVLVGASNSSATFEFALAVRRNGLGTLVGQPTGGNQRGINGGAFYFLRLPGSRIEVDLPLIGFYPRQPAPDRGLTPDVAVRVTATDIAQGRDPELDAVRRGIARHSPPALHQ